MSFDKSWIMNLRFIIAWKRKITSMIRVANLHSVPWNITSKAHKDSNNAERKMNLQACIGETVAFTMRVKPGFLMKQQRHQRRQQQSNPHTWILFPINFALASSLWRRSWCRSRHTCRWESRIISSSQSKFCPLEDAFLVCSWTLF